MKAELHWYVAQVMTGSEQETARKLTDAGMEAIAPVQILHERRHGKWWPIRRVVFPSYVFVRTAMTPRFYYFISSLPRRDPPAGRRRAGAGAGRADGSSSPVCPRRPRLRHVAG